MNGAKDQGTYVIANVFTAEAVRAAVGWRFQTLGLRPVRSTRRSHFDVARRGS